jgi:hypothetical protein
MLTWFRQLSVQRFEEKLTIKISGLRTISEITAERKNRPHPRQTSGKRWKRWCERRDKAIHSEGL